MSAIPNRQWILNRRPVGDIADGDLSLVVLPRPVPGDGEVLIRNRFLSLDPTNRTWMSDIDGYMEPVALGTPMRGLVMGEVVESRSASARLGELVMTLGTWGDYCVAPAANLTRVTDLPGVLPRDYFAIFYLMAPTAYIGLVEIGTPRIGETIVVSAAAGAVGSLVGQIGKALGCRVVGIAGGPAKCKWIIGELGFDAAIDYRSDDVSALLRRHCPGGVDVYFDNVGGQILDNVMGQMAVFGRIVECGMIASYNAVENEPGPVNYGRILMKRVKVQGFIVTDHAHRIPDACKAMFALHATGRLKWRVHEIVGLERAVEAVKLLYSGGNQGKLLVKVP